MNNLFNTQEFQVILQAINALDIKGSDAIYIANLQTKINKTINNLKEKEDKAKDIINLEKKN